MANLTGFDASNYLKSDLLPEGDYKAVLVESKRRGNSNGTGEHLSLRFDLSQQGFAGRSLWLNLNLWHQSEKAVRTSAQKFAALCLAAGVPRPNDSSELHNREVLLRVIVERRADTGEEANVIAGFSGVERD